MNEVLLIEENDRAYFYRGRAYQDLNQESKALDDFNKAIALNPKFDFYFYSSWSQQMLINNILIPGEFATSRCLLATH